LQSKFPFGIDSVILFDSSKDFLKMNNLSKEIFYLIRGDDVIKKIKSQKNYTNKYLKDSLLNYYSNLTEKYPHIVFFKLRKAVLSFQYGDQKKGIEYLQIAKNHHPNHYLPKILLAFEYIQTANLTQIFEVLDIKTPEKELTSISHIFPKVQEMMSTEYLKFLFVLIGIYNEKAKHYASINKEEKMNNCIKQIYQFTSAMVFIDNKNPITIQIQNYLKTNPNYKL